MQKSVVIKQTWAIILMTPHYLLEATGTLSFTLQQGGWITVHKRAVLSQRVAKCSLHNSVKLSQCSPELDFNFFCNILGEWT